MIPNIKDTNKEPILPSELILNDDNSVYHLKVLNEHIADNVLLVGDQERVSLISELFDSIEFKQSNREFVTHTGLYKGSRFTVMSTGIGCDNIDIVINELDAAVNINPETRSLKNQLRSLNLIRLGTCGGLQENIPSGSTIVSTKGIGLDGVAHFYDLKHTAEEQNILNQFKTDLNWRKDLNSPYVSSGDPFLIKLFGKDHFCGITMTANGFFGPQGRKIRLSLKDESINDKLEKFEFKGEKICNYEMETSALYALSSGLGHKACSVCLVIANRRRKDYLKDYKPSVKKMAKTVIERLIKVN